MTKVAASKEMVKLKKSFPPYPSLTLFQNIFTPGMWQSKTLITIDERVSKIARTSVFYCHLTPVGRQMAIKYYVSYKFLFTFGDNINVRDCHLPRVIFKPLI